jgi:lysophospholipase L1-like esterase
MCQSKATRWLPKVLAASMVVQCWLQLPQNRYAFADDKPATNNFFLHDGDRVVFYGDSITEQGYYTTAIQTFVGTVCPSLNVSFINSGWAGDRAWGGEGGMIEERLRRDVIAHRPTVVTIMLGMNDPYYMNYDPKILRAFEDSLESIVNILQKDVPGVRITMLGTSPYDDISPGPQPKWEEAIEGGYNAVVRRFSHATSDVATRHKLLYVDMNQPLVELLNQAHSMNHDLAGGLIPDRIHPSSAAGLVMAAQLLNAWNAPKPVSSVHIDASTGCVVSTTGATVTDVVRSGGLRWTQFDKALPFPVDRNDPLVVLTLRCSPELKGLMEQRVCLTKLPNGKSSLLIDGQHAGTFSRTEWADGIDLSSLPTPMRRQAAGVAKLIQLRDQFYFTRWRQSVAPSAKAPSSDIFKFFERLSQTEQQLVDLQRVSAKPTPARFELVSP